MNYRILLSVLMYLILGAILGLVGNNIITSRNLFSTDRNFAPRIYREAPLTITSAPGHPDWLVWQRLPERYNYVVVTGSWPYACENRPSHGLHGWQTDKCIDLIDRFGITPVDHWYTAIWKRPPVIISN